MSLSEFYLGMVLWAVDLIRLWARLIGYPCLAALAGALIALALIWRASA